MATKLHNAPGRDNHETAIIRTRKTLPWPYDYAQIGGGAMRSDSSIRYFTDVPLFLEESPRIAQLGGRFRNIRPGGSQPPGCRMDGSAERADHLGPTGGDQILSPDKCPDTAVRKPPAQIENPSITVVIPCKGRLSHLRRTLPHVLGQVVPQGIQYHVLVVDYADPDGCGDYCRGLDDPHLAAIHVLDGAAEFNLSRARNIGANAAMRFMKADILCFLDADVVLHPCFIGWATRPIVLGTATLTKRDWRDGAPGTFGSCCVRASDYHAARGYDESLCGWGPEDSDFYSRVSPRTMQRHFKPWFFIEAITHSDAERAKFYAVADIGLSAAEIGRRICRPDRKVNPAGFGRSEARIYLPASLRGPDEGWKRIQIAEPTGWLEGSARDRAAATEACGALA